MTDLNKTFESRGGTHGDYKEQSKCSMTLLKELMDRAERNGVVLNDTQHHSLMLICTKLGRIATGSANEPDHWHDIAGYATLIERELNNLDYRTGERKDKTVADHAQFVNTVQIHEGNVGMSPEEAEDFANNMNMRP